MKVRRYGVGIVSVLGHKYEVYITLESKLRRQVGPVRQVLVLAFHTPICSNSYFATLFVYSKYQTQIQEWHNGDIQTRMRLGAVYNIILGGRRAWTMIDDLPYARHYESCVSDLQCLRESPKRGQELPFPSSK